MLRKPIFLIDSPHGIDTPGKRSPDGRLREYRYGREVACGIVDVLTALGETAFLLVKEETDVPLAERVARVKAYCRQYGTDNVILISPHVNAAGRGGWLNGRGWCVYTSPGQTKSDVLATYLFNAAKAEFEYFEYDKTFTVKGPQKPLRADYSDGDPDHEARFYILVKTPCIAVLTESLFQDNEQDVEFLLHEGPKGTGRGAIINLHVEGILNYLKDIRK